MAVNPEGLFADGVDIESLLKLFWKTRYNAEFNQLENTREPSRCYLGLSH